MQKIQAGASSKISRLAGQVSLMGKGGPESKEFTKSEFYKGQQEKEYKDFLARRLIGKGLDKKETDNFVNQLRISAPGSKTNATNMISIGRTQIHADEEDFFKVLLHRAENIKGGKKYGASLDAAAGTSQSGSDFLRDIIEETNSLFTTKEFRKGLETKIANQWNAFAGNNLVSNASAILTPQKAVYQDYLGTLSSTKKDFLQRKTAQVLGVSLKDGEGRAVSSDIIREGLARRGFNPNDFSNLRSYLIRNKKMTSGIFEGNFNALGIKPLLISEAIEKGKFSNLSEQDQLIIKNLAGRVSIDDPVSRSIGANKLGGVYQSRSGQTLDFTSVKQTFSNVGHFFAGELQVPIIKLNPADLFGYRSFRQIAERGPLQYSPGRTVQPFGELPNKSAADFYMWRSTKGTKGQVTAYSTDELSGKITGETLRGTYRPLPTRSTEMLTRHARLASGQAGSATYNIGDKPNSFLDRILGGPERTARFKDRMAVDSEQPNSLFRMFSRFSKRSQDVNNPNVISRLLSGDEVLMNDGGVRKPVKIGEVGGKYGLVDKTGRQVHNYSEEQILRGVDSFRKSTFGHGYTDQIMAKLEESLPSIFRLDGLGSVAGIKTPQQARIFETKLEGMKGLFRTRAKAKGLDTRFVEESYSRIRNLIQQSNLLASSNAASKSGTITTRLDELKNEIFRYISQTNAIIGAGSKGTGGVNEMFINIQNILVSLRKTIPPEQYAEAQAAALSTLFNIGAFSTYSQKASSEVNARAALGKVLDIARSSSAAKGTFEPYTRGTISEVTTGIKRPFKSLLPVGKRIFGSAPYQSSQYATDPLGSGQGITFVPTFGTVFEKSPFGAIKSALGIGTYKNTENYSTASTAMSQGVERLNRYFGSIGMQLDVSKFGGPVDLYMRGMVGKRVLPLYAAGVTAFTVDRTIGGAVNEKDTYGERVYSPFFTTKAARGVVEARSMLSGLTPGGMNFEDKKEQLTEGVVPIRQGRFWPLGNTPFAGGKIQYYRPSWYRKLEAGAMFTSDAYGSPMEKFLYYNDISPLRPLDPYRFERKHYSDRPYPVSGEYFTGPFGPAVPALNATLGRILKPRKMMHEGEVSQSLGSYIQAGQSGAYDPTAYISGGGGFGAGGYSQGDNLGGGRLSAANARYGGAAGSPMNTARGITQESIAGLNAPLSQMAYGPTRQRGIMSPTIIGATPPVNPQSPSNQTRELGYRAQEMAGIYGFGFSTLREKLGLGQRDFQGEKPMLQSAAKAYGTTRAFWDLNIGGAGDIPLPAQGALGNLEFSEIIRRFIPQERTGIDYINPIKNTMGQQYPFLPGAEYYTDFTRGDPFTKVQEGELRLPGIGYERFNQLYPDKTGKYGMIDQLRILGDVAPYSNQYKKINSDIDSQDLTVDEKIKVEEIRNRVKNTTKKYSFTPYKYKYDDDSDGGIGLPPSVSRVAKFGEYLAHRDTLINTKFMQKRTAQEDWERRNVYGATFPQWQKPYETFIKPMIQKATQRDPISAAAGLSIVGTAMGRTPKAKVLGGFAGATIGALAGTFGNLSELITGDRYIPKTRKKQLALDEYADILTYTKNTRLAKMAEQSGNRAEANQYRQAAGRTMYGADIYGAPIETLSLAIPKRKREHFAEMINAPEQEREAILSTAPRLERRIYQAAWGMAVEAKPDLGSYFAKHELPDLNWEGWNPNTNMDHIKIKIGENMGLDMAQMGYYPQELKQANLTNPSYPEFSKNERKDGTLEKLRRLLSGAGISGSVTPIANPFGSNNIDISAGIR